jgi:hypothetical protein
VYVDDAKGSVSALVRNAASHERFSSVLKELFTACFVKN